MKWKRIEERIESLRERRSRTILLSNIWVNDYKMKKKIKKKKKEKKNEKKRIFEYATEP